MANTYWGGMRMSGNGGGGGGSINTSQLTQDILDGVEEIIRPSGHQYPNMNLYPKQFRLRRDTTYNLRLSVADDKYFVEHMDVSRFANLGYILSDISSTSDISLDLTAWDVSNAEVANSMCYQLYANNLDVSGWDVRKLTDMRSMFFYCYATTIDVSDWNVTNVTTMANMFSSCTQLTSLDLSTWDTSYVSYFSGMLDTNIRLTSLLWGGAINANDASNSPALDLSSTAITPANANLFFQSLGTKTSSGTTTIKMPSASQGADLSIAEAKGYTISNITQP